MSHVQPNSGLKITALSAADAAKLLSKTSGRNVTEAMVQADIVAGAPANPDGSINLLQYAAWLVREAGNNAD